MSEVDSMRNHAIVSSLAGYPFLLSLSFAWIVAAVLSHVLPLGVAVWVYPLAGVPGIAVAMFLERRIGYMPPADPDPFASLGVQGIPD